MKKNQLKNSDWDRYWKSRDIVEGHAMRNNSYSDVVDILCRLSTKESNCIEIGCGTGTYAVELIARGRKCLATDMTAEALELAKKKGKHLYNIDVPTMKVDLFNMPFKDNEFDLIFSDGVIEHLNIQGSLDAMYKKLKPGGWLVTKVPSGGVLYKLAYYTLSILENKHMIEEWHNPQGWIAFAEKTNLTNISLEKCGSILIGGCRKFIKNPRLIKYIPRNIGRIHYIFYGQK